MHENSGNSVIFYAHYTTDGVSTASLTVTIDIYEVIRDGTATLVVDDGACTDVGAGIYRYLLASGTVDAAAEYIGVFHTATDTVDAQDIPAMWVIDRAGSEKLDNGVTLADDAITASKFDESTAFPLKSADTGSTQVARVGADSDTLETLSDEIAAVKAETAAILVDTGTDGVVIAGTQGAITWGQQKIIADADGEGALDIVNTGDGGGGVGIHTEGEFAGQFNEGTGGSSSGTFNIGVDFGLINQGNYGQYNTGTDYGLRNYGSAQNVQGYDPALALEETLTAIKGDGWTTETLVTLKAYVDEIETRLTATRAGYLDKLNVTGTLAHSDAAATYKADVSGLAPANEYDTELTAIQDDLDNPDQYKADVSALALKADLQDVEDKIDAVDAKVSAIDTDTVMSFMIDGFTFEQIVQIMASVLAGKLTRSGDTLTFRDLTDTVNRVIAETDANKQRTDMTYSV